MMLPSRFCVVLLALPACGAGATTAPPSADASTPPTGFPPGDGGTGAGDGGRAPAPPITPDDPGPADFAFTIRSETSHPISPYIYGTNAPTEERVGKNVALMRLGGNRWTAYNWENNASNAGTDYYNQNDSLLGGGNTPGEAVRKPVEDAHATRTSAIVTIPIQGYVAADKNGDGDVAQTANYLASRFRDSVAMKGSALAFPPDTGDGRVHQDELVSFLEQKFPAARTDPTRTIFYMLDNEPDLWSSTHPRIHPAAATYAEVAGAARRYAAMVKSVAPKALVLGPVSYGWAGFVRLQAASDANGRDFLEYFLGEMKAGEAQAGARLLDALDVHWYPEALGGGTRIIDEGSSPALIEARLQAPRSLWDPTYVETSWITNPTTGETGTKGKAIQLLPRLKEKIARVYPGTRLSLSEYYYGGAGHISGGLAQADVLGIFGREGVFAASDWHYGVADPRFFWGGFSMFRSYDGRGGSFGDTSIAAATSDVAATSVYASVDASDAGRLVIVALNKTSAPHTASVSISHTVAFTRAEVYRLTAASGAPVAESALPITKKNAFVATLPPMSVTTLVLRP